MEFNNCYKTQLLTVSPSLFTVLETHVNGRTRIENYFLTAVKAETSLVRTLELRNLSSRKAMRDARKHNSYIVKV